MNYTDFVNGNPKAFFEPVESKVQIVLDGQVVAQKKATIRGDTREFLTIVSDKYETVANRVVTDQFNQVAEEAGLNVDYKNAYGLRGVMATAFSIEFPDKKIVVNGKDESILRGTLINAFDGAAKLEMGFWRQTCSNGAGVFTKDTTTTFRHIGGINQKIVDRFRGFVEHSFGSIQTFANDLVELDFQDKDSISSMIEEASWLSKRAREAVALEWKQGEMPESKNGWAIYNAFTRVATHNIASPNVRASMDRNIFKMALGWLRNNG